jgi:methionyl-tRNA synthetase
MPREYEEFAFSRATEAWIQAVFACNAYIDEQAPWALRKTDPDRMNTVLYVLAETIRHLALIVQPVMPIAAGRILDQLSVDEGDRSFAAFGPEHALEAGTDLPKPEGVFPRFVEEPAA